MESGPPIPPRVSYFRRGAASPGRDSRGWRGRLPARHDLIDGEAAEGNFTITVVWNFNQNNRTLGTSAPRSLTNIALPHGPRWEFVAIPTVKAYAVFRIQQDACSASDQAKKPRPPIIIDINDDHRMKMKRRETPMRNRRIRRLGVKKMPLQALLWGDETSRGRRRGDSAE